MTQETDPSAYQPSTADALPSVSIVVPFYNEEENVVPVLEELIGCQPDAEIIAIDDGSSDKTWELMRGFAGIQRLRVTDNRGQSAAIFAGLRLAAGEVCVMMDGDAQNDPADIATLVTALAESGADAVCGYRATRKDTWSRRAASKVANRIRRMILDDGVRDTGCSLKAFRREAVELLVPFNGLHRYFPAIFKRAGMRIVEVPVNHRARTRGVSKYTNWNRALRGIYDLFGVAWLLNRKIHYPLVEHLPCTPKFSMERSSASPLSLPTGNWSATSASASSEAAGSSS